MLEKEIENILEMTLSSSADARLKVKHYVTLSLYLVIGSYLFLIEGGSRENLKKRKIEEHSPSGPYALVHRSKLSCFLVFMHMCILQITSMHKCTRSR